jgi:hypothetical protein
MPKWMLRACLLAALVALAAAGPPIVVSAKPAPKMAALRTEGPAPPLPVDLHGAGDFTILTKAGISTVPASAITGNIGVSPIAATAMTGFSLTADVSNIFSTSTQLVGQAFAADYGILPPPKIELAPALPGLRQYPGTPCRLS